MFRRAAKLARTEKRGHYTDSKTLTGYEFRSCVKLLRWEAELPQRSCADLESGRFFRPEHNLSVKPENRMFVWPADLTRARDMPGLANG